MTTNWRNNFWDRATYTPGATGPDEPFWWMVGDPTGPKPMDMMNYSTKLEDEKRARDQFLDVILDYAW